METDYRVGLTEQQVLDRLAAYGPNLISSGKKRGVLTILYEALKEPTSILLLAIGLIYLILQDYQELVSLLAFLILISVITTYQEFKTEKILATLKELSSPRALVIREAEKRRIPGKDLVPGDIVILSEGDRVPGDIRLLGKEPLFLDESILTGESTSIVKGKDEMILAGTMIVNGHSFGICEKTGEKSELGKIGKLTLEEKQKQSPLQRETRRLVKRLGFFAISLSALLFLYFTIIEKKLLEGLLAALTLAMAILPNEIPAVLLIFLAGGAWRMAKRNVLTRKIPAIEALGSMTTLCVDKTGTLTANQMTLQSLWNAKTESCPLELADADLAEEFHALMEYGLLASRQDSQDPIDKAIIEAGGNLLANTEHLHPQWKVEKEYPLSSELMAVTYAWKKPSNDVYALGAKGAPETIMDLCELPSKERDKQILQVEKMAAKGERVIAVAYATSKTLSKEQSGFKFKFLGLLGFADPIRGGVKSAINDCRQAGIRVVMITGDYPTTAKAIAKTINLPNPQNYITGEEIEALNEEALLNRLQEVNIFCRTRPEQKLSIVKALQKRGEVVAMTGDGVNDAPALRRADIGIAMGKRGSDVAREAGKIVLLDDNFSSIVEAVKTGRRTFFNLQKALQYLLAVHIPITVLTILPAFMGYSMLLLPIHIAFLHIVFEPISSIAFERAQSPQNLMSIGPRPTNSSLFGKQFLKKGLVQGILLGIAVTLIFLHWKNKGVIHDDVRTLTFNTLIFANLGLVWANIGSLKSPSSIRTLIIVSLGSVTLLCAILYMPTMRALFRFTFQHPSDIALAIFAGLAPCFLIALINKHFKD